MRGKGERERQDHDQNSGGVYLLTSPVTDDILMAGQSIPQCSSRHSLLLAFRRPFVMPELAKGEWNPKLNAQ